MRFVRGSLFGIAGLILLILTAIAQERGQAAGDAAASGARAALVLREIGGREAYAIVGGYEAWQKGNYPIVSGKHPK
jgi:hypothetical protein